MSDEQKREKAGGDHAPEEISKAPAEETAEGGSRKPSAAEADASLAKAGGAGEPPSGYADAPKPAANEQPVEEGAAGGAAAKPASEAKAAASAEPGDAPAAERAAPSDAEKEAKAKAAAEARAARAAARAGKAEAGAEPAAPKEPSPNQPLLDRLVAIIKESLGEAVEEAWINEKGGHVPCVAIKRDKWTACAELLREHPELKLSYLRNITGSDMETHMEVAYHLISFEAKQDYCVKVKTDRDKPSIPSATPIWPTANWNEREIYDLLGIDFPGHPDLRRIMMADDWVGHPLRKDYEPLDPEV